MNLHKEISKILPADVVSLWLPSGKSRAIDLIRGNHGKVIGANHNVEVQTDVISPELGWKFNGSSDYIDCGTDKSLLRDAFSVSAWVRATSGITWQVIIRLADVSVPSLQFFYDFNDGRPLIFLAGGNFRYFKNNDPIDTQDNRWHFVTFVITGNGQNDIDNARLYIDEQEPGVFLTTKTGYPGTKTWFQIGRYSTSFFNGSIALIFLSESLSKQQHTNFYNATKGMFWPRG